MDNNTDTKSLVNSVLRGCGIVELIAADGPEVSLAHVAEAMGLTRPTAHRLLSTLNVAGWVRKAPSGRYSLTGKLASIGAAASRSSDDLRLLIRPVLAELAASTGDTGYLLVPRDGKALCVDRVEGPHPIRVHHVSVGDLLSLSSGAAPLAILAFRPDLLGHVAVAAAERDRLDERLSSARASGFIVSPDDLLNGVTAIGAPVYDSSGIAVAGISVTGTNDRLRGEHGDEAVRLVVSAAAEASGLLGYRPSS
jgi:DNA-binding IclR family transcriptional regulator